jgi:hypothetical protein
MNRCGLENSYLTHLLLSGTCSHPPSEFCPVQKAAFPVVYPASARLTRQPRAVRPAEFLSRLAVEDMTQSNEPVPEPLSAKSFSGRFMIRIPPQLHRRLAT